MKTDNQIKTIFFMIYTLSKLILEIINSKSYEYKKNIYNMDFEAEEEDVYFNDIIMNNIIKVEQVNNDKISLGFKIFKADGNNNNFYYFKVQKGFTLIELMMVISIGLLTTFISFQKMLKEHENTTAKIAGQQIKQIGNSVNSYIAVHYDKIAILKDSENVSIDLGPRTCNNESATCEISLKTLINEGLLPSTYSDKNIFNSNYKIILRRSGNSPYYNVHGLITTNDVWIGTNNAIRYDLLGVAMQEAGIDSGMSRENANIINGYKGLWSQKNEEYENINKLGQLAYQVGYGSYSYSIYLRRDGTLPMTGNLNMGTKNINNVEDITAAGLIQSKNLNVKEYTTLSETKISKDLYVSGNSTMEGYLKVNNTINATSNIISDNQIKGKNLISEDRATFEEYVQINGKAVANTNCNSNGLIGREVNGKLLSCVNGKWENNNSSGFKSVSSFSIYPGQNINLGLFKLCVTGYRIDGKEMAQTHLYPSNQPNGSGQMNWIGQNATQYSSYNFIAYCFN